MTKRSRLFGILIGPVLALILAGCVTTDAAPKKKAKITGSYVLLISEEGRKRINRSAHRADYNSLMATFTTQERQTLCSVATGVSILNALPIKRPVDPKYKPYPFFTQANYFNDWVETIIDRTTTLRIGQTLEQAAMVMTIHGATAKHIHAADSSAAEFRRIAKRNMREGNNFIAINYRRNFVGQPPGAHFSPLGAYDEATDSFLILDVARYKFPPVWVKAEDLFRAMNTMDTDSGKTRGFIVVSASST
jgi:hypothetical protein